MTKGVWKYEIDICTSTEEEQKSVKQEGQWKTLLNNCTKWIGCLHTLLTLLNDGPRLQAIYKSVGQLSPPLP